MITPTRRDLLRYLLMTPMAFTVDIEQVLWVPKPIIVVPVDADPSWDCPADHTRCTVCVDQLRCCACHADWNSHLGIE